MPGPFTSPVALSTPFEPNRNPQYGGNVGPSGITSENVQDAIEEAKADALANDRFLVLGFYGGNANTGRYLEFFAGSASDVSPIFVAVTSRLLTVTFQTTSASATATLGFFDLNVSSVTPVYSLALVAGKRVSATGVPLATFLPNALIAVSVTSGSLNTPTLQFTLSSST